MDSPVIAIIGTIISVASGVLAILFKLWLESNESERATRELQQERYIQAIMESQAFYRSLLDRNPVARPLTTAQVKPKPSVDTRVSAHEGGTGSGWAATRKTWDAVT